jgi:hypothetical protein
MMPSVIPARLQFQCGHAALVTLPRVKGETATQRNGRVAREKEAALSRQCDFCAPVNGTPHVELDTRELETTTPIEELAVIVSAAPELEPEPEPVPVAEEPTVVVAEEPEPVIIAEEPVLVVDEQVTVAEEPEAVVPEPVSVKVNGTNGTAVAKPARKQRARRQSSEMVERGQRFLVEYRLERVVRADSIHDALRQLATYGAAEVVAITRED